MVDRDKLGRAAYAMERAYRNNITLDEAVNSVSSEEGLKDLPDGILIGMWYAIDAYVDNNVL